MEELILDSLVEGIACGSYPPHEPLPSENNLSARFKVSRHIVRSAYTRLEEMGYIRSIQGKGRFLKEKSSAIVLDLRGNVSFTSKLKAAGAELETQTLWSEQAEYSEKIWEILNTEPADPVYNVGRLRIIEKIPTAIHISYISARLFPGIAEEGTGITSMYKYFNKKGYHEFEDGKTRMSVTLPTLREQEILDCPPLVPILMLEAITYSTNQYALQYSEILYRSDIFKFTF